MSEDKFHVGQEVWRHDVNGDRRGGPKRVTVIKVGRTLVTTQGEYGRPETFEIATGQRNDKYRHSWLCTDEKHAEHIERGEALARLSALGLRFDYGAGSRYSTAAINAACDALGANDDQEATR